MNIPQKKKNNKIKLIDEYIPKVDALGSDIFPIQFDSCNFKASVF